MLKSLIRIRRALRTSSNAGFSLVEMVIYIGVLSLILVALVNMAFIIQTSRVRFMALSDVHAAASRVLSAVSFLVRNSDGFVEDSSGNDCFYTNKLWLYFATSSVNYLPPGCSGDYETTAVSVEHGGTDGAETPSAYSFVVDDTFMYSVYVGTTLTKRYLSDLSLDKSFGDNGSVTLTVSARDIALSDGYLYISGTTNFVFGVEKRSAQTGAADTSFDGDGVVESSGGYAAYGIAVDGNYIYLAGDTSTDWRIEKRLKSTGALCTAAACGTAFDTDGIVTATGNYWQNLYDIAIDGTYMYLVGDYVYHTGGFPGTTYDASVIEKRLLSTGAYDTNFGSPNGYQRDDFAESAQRLAIDGTYMYVTGYDDSYTWRVRKFSLADGTFQCVGFGIAGTVPLGITIDGTYMYVGGQNGPLAGYNELIVEKRLLADCEYDTSFGSPNGYVIGTTGSETGNSLDLIGPHVYVGTDLNVQRRDASTGALAPNRHGVRLVCYQNYPSAGKNATCSSDPLYADRVFMDLADSAGLNIGSGDLAFATTTLGNRQAISTTLAVGYDAEYLLPTMQVSTTTASSTAVFRKNP